MANLSVAASPPILASEPQVNEQALIQRFFEVHGYALLRKESDHALYVRLDDADGQKYCICDLLIVAYMDAERVQAMVPKMDALAEQIRRTLLRGKPVHKDASIQKHPFMRLHRPLIQYSTTYNSKPVGYLIRPLILVPERDLWDYQMGSTTRIDVVSFEGKTLNYYVQEHLEELKNTDARVMDLKKFYYPRIAQKVLGYGHYPLIGLWLLNFFYAIFQVPFPLDLGGMILLTVFLYGGLLGTVYLLHQMFKRALEAELQEPAPFQSTRSTPSLPTSVVLEEVGEPGLTNSNTMEASPPQNVGPSEHKATLDLRATIDSLIKKVIVNKEPEKFNDRSQQLLRDAFHYILEANKQEIPRNSPNLLDLLKLVRTHSAISSIYRPSAFWINKLLTQTPFGPDELVSFKRYLLGLLYKLRLLPDELDQAVKKTIRGEPTPDKSRAPPIPPILEPSEECIPKLEEAPIRSTHETGANEASKDGKKEDPPDIEVDSQSFIEIPEVNAYQFRRMREKESYGAYCALIIDKRAPDFLKVTQQFEAGTKNYDINRVFINIDQLDDSFLEREIAASPIPAIAIGCGSNTQTVSYGAGTGDAARLHSLIISYLAPRQDRKREGQVAFVGAKEKSEGRDEAPIILLKSRQAADEGRNAIPESIIQNSESQPENQRDIERENGKEELTEPLSPNLGAVDQCNTPQEPTPNNQEYPIRDQLTEEAMTDGTPLVNGDDPSEQMLVTEEPVGDSVQGSQEIIKFIKNHHNIGRKFLLERNMRDLELILIDGNNLAFLLKDTAESGPEPHLDCIFQVIEMLADLGFRKEKMVVCFDANIEHKFAHFKRFEDLRRFKEHIDLKRVPKFREVTGGVKADTALVSLGVSSKGVFIIVTNDGLKHCTLGKRHRVGVMLDNDNVPRLLVDSVKELLKAFYGKIKLKVEGVE